MLKWLQLRNKELIRYFKTLGSIIYQPYKFADAEIITNDQTNYYRALNFLATGLSVTIAVEVAAAWLLNTEFSEIWHTIAFALQFITYGFLIWITHIIFFTKKENIRTTYHCYAYILGTFFPLSHFVVAACIVGFLLYGGVDNAGCDPLTVKCLVANSLSNSQKMIIGAIVFFAKYGFGLWGAVLLSSFVQQVQGIHWAVTMFGPSVIVLPLIAITAILST